MHSYYGTSEVVLVSSRARKRRKVRCQRQIFKTDAGIAEFRIAARFDSVSSVYTETESDYVKVCHVLIGKIPNVSISEALH